MKKFYVILEWTDGSLTLKKVFEKPETPGLKHKIFIHDWIQTTFATVNEVRHFLDEDVTELYCKCSLDDICLAYLKTGGWTVEPGSADNETFQRRRVDLRVTLTASQII